MHDIVTILNQRGVKASLEYPGYIEVQISTYWFSVWGDAAERFGGDFYTSGSEVSLEPGPEVITSITTDVPNDCEDVFTFCDAIQATIAKFQEDLAKSEEKRIVNDTVVN
jgi:hypothetical protein